LDYEYYGQRAYGVWWHNLKRSQRFLDYHFWIRSLGFGCGHRAISEWKKGCFRF
jgi:hypothetical protein